MGEKALINMGLRCMVHAEYIEDVEEVSVGEMPYFNVEEKR